MTEPRYLAATSRLVILAMRMRLRENDLIKLQSEPSNWFITWIGSPILEK